MRVLLVEPFHGGSHGSWADGYVRHSTHEVHLVSHSDERWRWRLRGSALTLAEDATALLDRVGPPDVVLASDMFNLPTFLGLTREAVGDAPVAAYFHESQLLYPSADGRSPHPEVVMANWLTMAAADLVVFNSAHHRDRLLRDLPGFLDAVGDPRHGERLADVAPGCEVLPVGVDLSLLSPPPGTADDGPPVVVWSHRWESDKRIEHGLSLLLDIAEAGPPFRLVLLGERPASLPPAVEDLVDRLTSVLGPRLLVSAHLPRPDYLAELRRADVVFSTAAHEFFGVAMVEAMAAGCVPVLPRAQSYPEIVPSRWHDAALHDPEGSGPGDHLRSVLADLEPARAAVEGLSSAMRRFDWATVAPAYDQRLAQLAGTR